jgi:hypothetical protein
VPKLVLTVNHASGAGYYAMAGQGFDPDFIFTWPTGRMGVMEGDSAVRALFGEKLDELKRRGETPDAELQGRIDQVRAGLRAAAGRPVRRRARLRGRGDPPGGDPRGAGARAPRGDQQPGSPPRALRAPRPEWPRHDRTIRIASGQGFWGDLLDAPVQQVENGPIDYLMLDYLAEVTMSIMQKQRARNPAAGTRPTSSR